MNNTKNAFSEVFEKLESYSEFGKKVFENGVVLLGKAPHIAPEAWLHRYGGGLSDHVILDLESELKLKIPSSFKDFLKLSNGLDIFVTTLSIYGKRFNYIRDINNASWQPFNILTPNFWERPENAEPNFLFIGSYKRDGSCIYIDTKTEKVHYCSRDNAESLLEWQNFETMLKSEVDRIIELFDKKGKKKDSNLSTLPIL